MIRLIFATWAFPLITVEIFFLFSQLEKITHTTIISVGVQPVWQGIVAVHWRRIIEKEARDLSAPPPRASTSALWSDDRKDKRGKQRDVGNMAWQLGSLLPCLPPGDKSWLFIDLSVIPAFYWAREDHFNPETRQFSKLFFKQIGSCFQTPLCKAWLLINFCFEYLPAEISDSLLYGQQVQSLKRTYSNSLADLKCM